MVAGCAHLVVEAVALDALSAATVAHAGAPPAKPVLRMCIASNFNASICSYVLTCSCRRSFDEPSH